MADSRGAGEHRFGGSEPLTIGVEEELLLVDEACALDPVAEEAIEAVGPEMGERVTTEIFATQIELKTGVCRNAGEAAAQLTELRHALQDAGYRLVGSGLHPDDSGEPVLLEKSRYAVVKKDLAGLLRTPPCGLHVHVGMPDPETAIRVANALRRHLPLLQALTANSPFKAGEDTGLASARAAEVAGYPRFEMPRSFRDYDDFLRVADQLIKAAGVDDYTYLWWDLRPHPKIGTVEVRAMDAQTGVEEAAAVAALIQALAAIEIEEPSDGPRLTREALEESYFQAGRHGLDARLMVDDSSAAPAREVAARVLEEARPHARRLGGDDALEPLEQILREGDGADLQRRAHDRGGMPGLLADLIERSRVV
jgi:carboxylate-amine ligase